MNTVAATTTAVDRMLLKIYRLIGKLEAFAVEKRRRKFSSVGRWVMNFGGKANSSSMGFSA